jgi:hypothetical protein
VRQLLVQREVGEKRANWVTTLQEYDLILNQQNCQGQGFCRLLAGASNIQEHEDSGNNIEEINEISIIILNLNMLI